MNKVVGNSILAAGMLVGGGVRAQGTSSLDKKIPVVIETTDDGDLGPLNTLKQDNAADANNTAATNGNSTNVVKAMLIPTAAYNDLLPKNNADRRINSFDVITGGMTKAEKQVYENPKAEFVHSNTGIVLDEPSFKANKVFDEPVITRQEVIDGMSPAEKAAYDWTQANAKQFDTKKLVSVATKVEDTGETAESLADKYTKAIQNSKLAQQYLKKVADRVGQINNGKVLDPRQQETLDKYIGYVINGDPRGRFPGISGLTYGTDDVKPLDVLKVLVERINK